MYYATEDNPTVKGAFGAAAGGVVSGAAGGQGGYLLPNGAFSNTWNMESERPLPWLAGPSLMGLRVRITV